MPKKPKSGPPYTDIPEEVYVVVTNPWGMNSNPRLRDKGDFNRIASWAQFALQQAGLGGIPTIECIYGMGTRDEIILQFAEGTDIVPLLGEHRWSNFAKHYMDPSDRRSTCVFIYNWRNNGDPANHNWSENFPKSLSLDTVPAKSPYPAPSWISPPHTLTNLVHPIPPPILPPIFNRGHSPDQEQQPATTPPPSTVTPSPAPPEQRDQPESGEQPVAQDSVSTSLFTPYKPPAQHPSHARFLNGNQVLCEEASSSRASPPSPKFIKKLDPYELDEDALNALRSPNPDQDTKGIKNEDIKLIPLLSVKAEIANVKMENDDAQHNITSASDSRYQPSQALIDAFNSLRQPEQSPPSARPPSRDPRGRPNAALETVPPASSGYRPSAKLEADMNALLRGRTNAASSSSAAAAAAAIKRVYEDDAATSPGEAKKIKIEEY